MKITPTMRRAGLYGLVVMSALGAVGQSTAAHATEVPAPATTKTVAWVVTSGDLANRFGTPQTLFGGEVGACGQPLLQVDVYRYDTPEHIATVDALTSKGVLNSAAEDGTVWISNVDLAPTEACAPTPEPTATPTATPPVTPPATSTPSPSTEPTKPPVAPTTKPVASTSQPTAPVTSSPTVDAKAPKVAAATPTAEALAFTGSKDMRPFAVAAFLLITAGACFLARAIVIRRRGKMER